MVNNSYSVMVVEDEVDILNLMCLHLSREGYQVHSAQTGKQAYDRLSSSTRLYDLIILDWMIPEISGLQILKWIRSSEHVYHTTPVLFVTAKSGPKDIVYGLEHGADDYITKPFDLAIFKARVKNLIRRARFIDNASFNETKLSLGKLNLNTDTYKVFIKDKEVTLTFSEFRLLEILLRNQGKALSRKKMISFIQGENVNVTGRTIDTHITILRKKIGNYGKFIETVRGVGYRIGFP